LEEVNMARERFYFDNTCVSRRVPGFPPEEYVIQGLMKPEPPRRPSEKRGNQLKRSRRMRNGGAKMHTPLCEFCDYRDLVYGFCLLKRLGHTCPYLNGNSGIVLVNMKNGEKRKAVAAQPLH